MRQACVGPPSAYLASQLAFGPGKGDEFIAGLLMQVISARARERFLQNLIEIPRGLPSLSLNLKHLE